MKLKAVIYFLFLFVLAVNINAQGSKFVGSKNSDKYHLSTCKSAQRISSKNLVKFESVREAKNKGYKPCKICKPDK